GRRLTVGQVQEKNGDEPGQGNRDRLVHSLWKSLRHSSRQFKGKALPALVILLLTANRVCLFGRVIYTFFGILPLNRCQCPATGCARCARRSHSREDTQISRKSAVFVEKGFLRTPRSGHVRNSSASKGGNLNHAHVFTFLALPGSFDHTDKVKTPPVC